jgi:chloramphenicol-sensitive protein RarD
VTELLKGAAAPVAPRDSGPLGQARTGLAFGLGAYVIWGFIPLYFRALAGVSPLIILCHRIIWSALFIGLIVSVRGEWPALLPVVSRRRNLFLLCAGAVLIALNWLLFIYAVATHQLLQASLGYFINPILSIALGMIFLRERLRSWQWVAVAIAGGAVLNLTLRGAGLPWLALSLAGSFGFYGLVRKTVDINSLHGLMVESALLVPLALLGLVLLPSQPLPVVTWGVLSLSGPITAVPLLFFGAALRRLRLSTMGFLQFVGPTLQFLVALVLFHEPLDRARLGTFVLCWAGIGVYLMDSLFNRQAVGVADEPD